MNDSERLVQRTRQLRHRQRNLTLLTVDSILMAGHTIAESALIKEPYHTSVLTGQAWVLELLQGHPERIRCELGVHLGVFEELLSQLQRIADDRSQPVNSDVSLEEQLAIFLYMCVTGLTIRHVGERFQRSGDTISRYFRQTLRIFSSPPFYGTYVRLPTASDPVPPHIYSDAKLWPFFKDCLGALDGTHIPCSPPASEQQVYRNRKGLVTQNCLFGCSFRFTFVYALAGWEGSATDALVYENALSNGLLIPEGKYYLADAGYPLSTKLLVPYRGVRNHLSSEHSRASFRPTNKEELFNLRHASARNVVERIFGVLKKRFRILLLAPDYDLEVQSRIPVALCALHNFIAKYEPSHEALLPDPHHDAVCDLVNSAGVEPEPAGDASAFRDKIAEMMWGQYQQTGAHTVSRGNMDEYLDAEDEDEDEDY